MGMYRLTLIGLCCLMLAAGCTRPSKPPRPVLDLEDEPDTNVQPPSWYKPGREYSAWPLSQEPKHGTEEWRQWCALRYNSRDVVRRISKPPKIDGRLNDAAWKNTAFKARFVDVAGRPASPGTTVWLAYDAKNLYVAARVEELYPTKLRAKATQRDRPIQLDDHLDIGLVPDWTQKVSRVYWLYVNSKGTVSDGVDSSIGWSPDLKAAATIEQESWNFELAIPLDAFGVKASDLWGGVWACRFVRRRHAGGPREISSWTRLLSAKDGACNWGHVIFKGVRPPKKEPPPPPKPVTDKKPKGTAKPPPAKGGTDGKVKKAPKPPAPKGGTDGKVKKAPAPPAPKDGKDDKGTGGEKAG